MLGQLLHSINPSSRRGLTRLTPLDSQTEDAHTRSLLFPDAHVLNQPTSLSDSLPGDAPLSAASHNNATDCGVADIDLEASRDVRIIIAQNFTGQQDSAVLFDSSPSHRAEPHDPQIVLGSKAPATAPSSRRPSAASTDSGRRSPSSFGGNGAFHQRSRLRNTSVSATLPFIDETAPAKPKDDPVRTTALECMFENAQSSYKGTSNRIHIVPLEPRPNETVLSSPTFADGPASLINLGRLPGSRRSHLATSYTPGETVPHLPPFDGTRTPRTPARDNRRRTVLISRTFTVPWLEESDSIDASDGPTPTQSDPHPSATAYPFPRTGSPRKLRIMPPHGGSKTLPMYGVSIVLQLPIAPSANGLRRNQSGYFPPMPHGADSIASSLGSDGRNGGWSFVDSVLGTHSSMSDSFSSDVDDRVDLVGQHWDIISRSLTALQLLAQEKILAMLRPQARAFRPQLQPGAFTFDNQVKVVVDATSRRLVRGFKIPRVRTGQGRWGIWREEALWLTRYTSGKEPGAFVLRLLTAFLGQHTDWMRVLGPRPYRRQYREQQHSRQSEDLTIPCRTVIVADSKMAARRMIFLLAAFLPAVQHVHGAISPARPGTSASLRAYSQSPPNNMGLSRQESLRRTINRRGKTSASRTRQSGRDGQSIYGGSDNGDDRTLTGVELVDPESHVRRGSDARSMLGAPLPGGTNEEILRKSSAATMGTVTPDTTVPAAHFSTHRNTSSADLRAMHRRPGSSGSLASANLTSALQRDNTGVSSESTAGGSRWGSLTSFWSSGSRRESSTDYSDILQSTDEGLGILSLNGSRLAPSRSSNKLEQMVLEAEGRSARSSFDGFRETTYVGADEHQSPDIFPADGDDHRSPRPSTAQPVAQRHDPPESPFKMRVSESGVIDVEIPFLDFAGSPPPRSPFLSSLGAHDQVTHHHHHHHHSASFNSTASNSPNHPNPPLFAPQLHSIGSLDTIRPLNVAGWLTYLHADFALQAVMPYGNLEKDIRAAMSAEPTPASATNVHCVSNEPVDKWVDMGHCLIADTKLWTLRRLSLRRLVRFVPVLGQPVVTPGITPGAAPLGMASRGAAERAAARNRHGLPFDSFPAATDLPGPSVVMSEIHLKEEWNDELVTDMDATLVDALTQVVDGTSTSQSRTGSTASSRSSSRRGRMGADPTDAEEATADSATSSVSQATLTLGTTTSAGMAPRDTKRAIVGALERIVCEVVIERKEAVGESLQPGEFEARTSLDHAASSILREGVSRWLAEVEEYSQQLRY